MGSAGAEPENVGEERDFVARPEVETDFPLPVPDVCREWGMRKWIVSAALDQAGQRSRLAGHQHARRRSRYSPLSAG
jgi:hypothetical protein